MNTKHAEGISLRTALYIAFAVLLLAAATGKTDGFRNPPEGAAVQGRGGVDVAGTDDATAVVHNPANTADAQQTEVLVTATIGYSSTEFDSASGAPTDKSNDPWVVLPSVFAVMPISQWGAVLGLGLHFPYGQSKDWDRDSSFRFSAPHFAEMKSANVTPTLAKRLNKQISVGVGPDIMWSDLQFDQTFPLLPPPAGLSGPTTELQFEGDGVGIGAHAGITWDVNANNTLAVTYRAPVSVDYEGDFQIDPYPPGAFPPPVSPSSDFDTTINFPQVVKFGYALQVTPEVRLQANVDWCEHSRNQSLDLDIQNNNALLLAASGTTSLPQDWDDTWTFAFGGDWQIDSTWTLRSGYTFLPTPIPDATLSPVLAEGDKHVIGVGAGYAAKAHHVDLSYALNIQEDREITDPANPVQGTYQFDQHLLAASYSYAF